MRLLVLALAALSPMLAQQVPAPSSSKKTITVESIYGESAKEGGPEGLKWSPDGKKLSFVERQKGRGELYYFDPVNGIKSVLVSAEKLQSLAPPVTNIKDPLEQERRSRYAVAEYLWAPDSAHLLFDANGQLWYFSLASNTGIALTAGVTKDPKFSPDGKEVSFIRDGNIFVRNIEGNTERQITGFDEKSKAEANARKIRDEHPSVEMNDGDKIKNILNGDIDWVYTEELSVRSNYFWSPNSKQVLYLQMDQSKVPTYPIVDYIPTHPQVTYEKYPKAGDPNSIVRLGLVSAAGGGTKWIHLDLSDKLLSRFGWVRDGIAYAIVLNRIQNKTWLYFIDTNSGTSREVMSESSDAWINTNDDFRILSSGDKFLWTSWRDGFNHIYLYSFDRNHPVAQPAAQPLQLTKGDFDVVSIATVNDRAGMVYFLSNEGDPRQVQLYSVKLDGSGKRRITKEDGTYSAEFDADGVSYISKYSSIATPPQTSVCDPAGKCTLIFAAKNMSASYNLISPQFVNFKADDGTTLYASLIMLRTADANHKVPVVLAPYGGPTAQRVRNQWAPDLFNQILAAHGMAVLVVDNHGSSGRGREFAAKILHNLGEIELKDQLTALDQVLVKFPALDGNRVGITGWSYGGFMVTYAMTHSDRFKAGLAGGPVTDWRNYDSIYTERYMDTPTNNPEGYNRSSVVKAAANLKGHLLIAHGTSDDNVHLQNTIQLINEFMDHSIPYDLQLYPRKTHGVTGSAPRIQLWGRVLHHLEQYLQPDADGETK